MNKYLAFSVFFGLLFGCTFAIQSCGKGGSNSVVIGLRL